MCIKVNQKFDDNFYEQIGYKVFELFEGELYSIYWTSRLFNDKYKLEEVYNHPMPANKVIGSSLCGYYKPGYHAYESVNDALILAQEMEKFTKRKFVVHKVVLTNITAIGPKSWYDWNFVLWGNSMLCGDSHDCYVGRQMKILEEIKQC